MTEPKQLHHQDIALEQQTQQKCSPPELTLEQQMQQKCREWQQRLRLADWDVTVKVVPAMDMSSTQAQGCIHWRITEKTADIKLVTPEDAVKQNPMRPYNLEETLIHELLHLHMAPFEPDSSEQTECMAMEWTINAIAGALLKLANSQESANV